MQAAFDGDADLAQRLIDETKANVDAVDPVSTRWAGMEISGRLSM